MRDPLSVFWGSQSAGPSPCLLEGLLLPTLQQELLNPDSGKVRTHLGTLISSSGISKCKLEWIGCLGPCPCPGICLYAL
jgi:hypothetical protein